MASVTRFQAATGASARLRRTQLRPPFATIDQSSYRDRSVSGLEVHPANDAQGLEHANIELSKIESARPASDSFPLADATVPSSVAEDSWIEAWMAAQMGSRRQVSTKAKAAASRRTASWRPLGKIKEARECKQTTSPRAVQSGFSRLANAGLSLRRTRGEWNIEMLHRIASIGALTEESASTI